MPAQPASRPARRAVVLPAAILIACCVLGFAGRWLFVKWIVSSAGTTINRAQKALATDRPESARQALNWLLWAEPQQPDALYLTGLTWQAEERIDEALACFDRIPPAAIPRSVTNDVINRGKGNDEHLIPGRVENKVHREASSAAALLCLADSRLDVAEQRLVKHLQLYPDSPEIRDELRWLYFNQLRTRELEGLLERELEKFPLEFSLAIDLLSSEFRKQLPREGIGYLQAADKRHPDQAMVKAAIGYCLWQIGQPDDARAMFEQSLELRPDEIRVRQVVADFLLEQGGQLEQAKGLLASHPADDYGWYLLSRCSEQQRQIEVAEEQMQSALRQRPGELKYVQRRGELLRRLGRTRDADKTLQEANRLEAVQTELSELVLRGMHEQPTVEICQRLAKLNQARRRDVQARAWERAAKFLTEHPERRPTAQPGGRTYPAGRGPM